MNHDETYRLRVSTQLPVETRGRGGARARAEPSACLFRTTRLHASRLFLLPPSVSASPPWLRLLKNPSPPPPLQQHRLILRTPSTFWMSSTAGGRRRRRQINQSRVLISYMHICAYNIQCSSHEGCGPLLQGSSQDRPPCSASV
jgi:hypothetical protein